MPDYNPAVTQWINQMGDPDQVVAYYAYQSLLEEVINASRPGNRAGQVALAAALAEALVAEAKPGQTPRGKAAFSLANNVFLASAAERRTPPLYPGRVRSGLARLLGYIPDDSTVPHLAKACADIEAREMARWALEANPSERATQALIDALRTEDPEFRAGVIGSLAKRRGQAVTAALRRAAADPQPEVREAALYALADQPVEAHDEVLAKAGAHIARARLAETLRASGNKRASEAIYKAILESDAPEPQKKAARRALG